MRTIVVATDFSTRSDRATRRGILLAKASNASLILFNAVDDDQPRHLVEIETAEAKKLLTIQTSALLELDGIEASHHVALGDPFTCIAQVAEEYACDLIVLGPHRRQLLKDVFVGTTAERTIRNTKIPIIMANSVPAAPYRHILVAIDMSEHSAAALRLAAQMEWGEKPALSIVHGLGRAPLHCRGEIPRRSGPLGIPAQVEDSLRTPDRRNDRRRSSSIDQAFSSGSWRRSDCSRTARPQRVGKTDARQRHGVAHAEL